MDFDNHKIKANHNLSFLDSFCCEKNIFKDWMVTVLFYTSLHCVDAFLAQMGEEEIRGAGNLSPHQIRMARVKEYLPELRKKYKRLYQFSREARYYELGDPFKWKHIEKYRNIVKNDFLPLVKNSS